MDISQLCDNVNRVLRYVSQRWSTNNDIEYTLGERDQCFGEQLLSAGEWFGVEPCHSTRNTVYVVKENFSVVPYTEDYRGCSGSFICDNIVRISSTNRSGVNFTKKKTKRSA